MSNIELESDSYDVVVIGTGIAESIAAAALAKAGKTVLHLDPNEYYGGEQASLTLDELVEWSTKRVESSSAAVSYTHASASVLTPTLQNDRRRYALSLFPAILPSRGPLIDALISSDVSKYVSFKLLDSVNIWDEGCAGTRKVPGCKEEIFKDKSVSLMDKRKLMKFFMFAAGEFEHNDILRGKETQPLLDFLQDSFALPTCLALSIAYAIAHCTSPEDQTLPALMKTRRYLKSLGRYGPSAFLVGQYGGAGEVAQGFCRGCAVYGGTYVLGPFGKPTSIDANDDNVTLNLPCHPRPVTAKHLISSSNHLPLSLLTPESELSKRSIMAHSISISSSLPKVLQRKLPSADDENGIGQLPEENDDTGLIVFPPENGNPTVRCLINGEGTGSCPPEQYVLYLSCPASTASSPSDLLKPYLQRIISEPLFESYYVSTRATSTYSASSPKVVIVTPFYRDDSITEGLDWEVKEAEKAYYSVMGQDGIPFFDVRESEADEMGISEDD
ncbi:rab escort protein [Cryptococcus neoformans Tu259-1]|uniref:Rab proteins geranylgeranyltransferase n=1 Tax=Cryptococcus neoformans Tu259-1 TaxID=1230072 RepID=A0A854QCF6_CRYNE|nr:rab escort protein [Cryptococcus neoformans var. grubii 125.91]OXG13066.1 rab escort protein [Cryptococcus neoformans var. grubii Tu259-1]